MSDVVVTDESFGEAKRFVIASDNLRVVVLERGATLSSVQLEGRELTLGFETPEEQRGDDAYTGATCGRFTGRIASGKFALDGEAHQLSVNDHGNTLHGGADGFDRRIWAGERFEDDDVVGARFCLVSTHGDQGFPGTLHVEAFYGILRRGPPSLVMRFTARLAVEESRATHVNIVNHAYWNLNGVVRGGGDCWLQPEPVLNHVLQIAGTRVLETDENNVATGDVLPVLGTPFDFSKPVSIGSRLAGSILETGRAPPGFDDTFLLLDFVPKAEAGKTRLRKVATIRSPITGIEMTVMSTAPALQLYTSNFRPLGATGAAGQRFARFTGVCLETQYCPNAPNVPSFPSTVLRPGEEFAEETIHIFKC